MHLIAAFPATGGIRQLSESTTGPTTEVQLNQPVNSGPFVAIVNGGHRESVATFETRNRARPTRWRARILYPDGEFVIVEYTRYNIDEKRPALFERVYEKAGEILGSSGHCLRYELSHCKEKPENYEEGHLNGFRARPEFKAFFALVQPYVKDIEEMHHYRLISSGENSQPASRDA